MVVAVFARVAAADFTRHVSMRLSYSGCSWTLVPRRRHAFAAEMLSTISYLRRSSGVAKPPGALDPGVFLTQLLAATSVSCCCLVWIVPNALHYIAGQNKFVAR